MLSSDQLKQNVPVIAAALRTIIVFIAVLTIPPAAAQTMGLSRAQTSAQIFALYGLPALLSLILTIRYREPLLLTGNLFVIIFISGLGEQLTYPEIVGASVVAGAGVLLVGMLGLSAYLASWVPTPIMFGHWLSSPSKFDSMYREGSPDYRAGRDVGRIVIYLIGVYEISQGVTVGLGAGSAIGPTGGATATSCALAETGVGAIGCLLGGVALTVEVSAVAGSAVAVAHGAGMIVYAAAHPPGSSGSGSGDLGGRSTSGPLQASDLDIKGEIASFDATYEFTDDTMTIRVRMIEGEIENPFEVVQNAMEFARSKGASVLRLEASIVNEQLYRIAQRRYGLVTQGGTDFIVIPLD